MVLSLPGRRPASPTPLGASVAFEMVPHGRLRATPPCSRVIGRSCHRKTLHTGELAGNCAHQRSCGLSQSGPFCTVFPILHSKGRNFPDVFFCSRLPMTPMNRAKFHGNLSARFSEIRNAHRQTDADRQMQQLYIYR